MTAPAPAAPRGPNPARLAGVLAAVCALAAGALAFSHGLTKAAIARQEDEARVAALRAVFFRAVDAGGAFALRAVPAAEGSPAFALTRPEEDVPAYFAVPGRGIGYNASVPIEVMAGFVNPAHPADARTLLAGYIGEERLPPAGERGPYTVGFMVVKSEETPGLGEKIKDRRPAAAWSEVLTGRANADDPDRATDFQRQFRGRLASTLVVGDRLDAITAATITTNGLIRAVRDAAANLEPLLAASPGAPAPAGEAAVPARPDAEAEAAR